ncbi:YitT family protein [Mesobacillus maritimus]|uniref:YitT family protein n=1 Tax=Mesobacillus maritimus TaxID=1643336 RepID=UPI00385077ED
MIKAFLGCFIMAIGVNAGFIPVQLFSVGFQGIGVLALYTFQVSTGLVVFLLNVPLFVLAGKQFGKLFLGKNIAVTGMLSIFLDILYPIHQHVHIPVWLGILIGGSFLGLGAGIIFGQGLTSGGVGLLARLIQMKFPSVKMGTFHIVFDFIVLFMGALLTDLMTAVYTFLASFISGRVIDLMKAYPHSLNASRKLGISMKSK